MKKILLMVVALAFSLAAHAQETVTLVVNGEGTTKEEATANALRSAIEQSFGVFVSANTQILDDEIVKDEIATIASGNIKEYKELGTVTMPDGRKSISLSATVSIKNLISYAKSKGSSTEFSGAIWGMNIKMRKLNAENERMAVDHMLEQLDILSRDMFKIELSTPKPPVKINWDNYSRYSHLKESYPSQAYFVDLNLTYYSTPTCKIFFDLLYNSIQSISLSDDEVAAYKESGESMYGLGIDYDGRLYSFKGGGHTINGPKYYFRNDIVESIISSIHVSVLNAQLSHWQIVRSSTDKGDESITFKTTIKSAHGLKWYSYPKNRIIELPTPLVSSRYGDIKIDHVTNMMNGNEIPIATFNIKIGFTEEELIKTSGFEIKKREDFDVNNIQPHNEIWCTCSSINANIKDMGGSFTYSAKNKCYIIFFENDVTKIKDYAFDYCTSLTSITIPNSVTEIGDYAFDNCTSLTSITIPNSVEWIDSNAFENCTSLTSITLPNSVTEIRPGAFSNINQECVVYVPVGRAEYYKQRSSCSGLNIIEMSSE